MRALVLFLATCASCTEEPVPAAPLVTCHNANCAYTEPPRDDTVEALLESLALETADGRAPIDGIELDFFWDSAARRCVFEHDLEDVPGAAAATDVAAIVATHLRARGRRAAWNGQRFITKLELKAGSGPDLPLMSPADMVSLADCVLEVAATLEAATRDAELEPTTLFIADDPRLLLALEDRPSWRRDETGPGHGRQFALAVEEDDPRLVEYAGVVNAWWRDTRDGDAGTYARLRDEGIDLMVTAFDLTESSLATLEYLEPTYINCNEAPIVRAWLER